MKESFPLVKIAFVRRSNVYSQSNDDPLSPKKLHIELQQGLDHVSEKLATKTTSRNNQKKMISSSPTPLRTIRTDELTVAEDIDTHNSNMPTSSQVSPSSPHPIQQLSKSVKEISCKTKWSTRKKILVGLSIALLTILVTVAIILAILLTQQKATTTTVATTTVSSTITSVSWSFDNTTTDFYNVYNGQLINGATYSVAVSYMPYASAVYFTSSSNQSFLVAAPFLDLTFTSFTIEAWIFPVTSFTGDRGIFSQCYCSSCTNRCFYLLLRANCLYAGFTFNDVASLSTLNMSTWYHIAFVYNYQTQQQILYLNGLQSAIKSNAQPYQGTNATIQIGVAQVSQLFNYFNGYIDNVNIVTRAKAASELLSDATLVAYYSFDLPYSSYDNGPNGLNGTIVYAVSVTGRVNQAMRFTGSSSYFQVYGFYRFGYATLLNKAYSISIWVNPASTISCTFVQMSNTQTGSTCSNMLGFSTPAGLSIQIIAQAYTAAYTSLTMVGPFISINTWTHISWTFSPGNGYTLYVNGNLFGSSGTSTSSSYTGTQMFWLSFGYSFACASSYVANVGYQGSIDEAYFYTRELTQAEVTTLANP